MRNTMLMLVLVVAVGCGKENNATNNPTNNVTGNNTVNVDPNNVTNVDPNNATNVGPNNTVNDTTNPNPRTEPYITQFRYYVENENALGVNNRTGFTISVISGDIANEDGNTTRLVEDDRAAFEADHLGASTIASMQNGWGCRVVVDGEDMGTVDAGDDMGGEFVSEATYWFEARVQEAGSTRLIHEITGCVLDADPDVMPIVDAIKLLGMRYL